MLFLMLLVRAAVAQLPKKCSLNQQVGVLECAGVGLQTIDQLPYFDWVKFADLRFNKIVVVDIRDIRTRFPAIRAQDLAGNPIINCTGIEETWITISCWSNAVPTAESPSHSVVEERSWRGLVSFLAVVLFAVGGAVLCVRKMSHQRVPNENIPMDTLKCFDEKW